MRFVNAIKFHRKSGGAKPRDLQLPGPLLETRTTMLKPNRHLAYADPKDKVVLAAVCSPKALTFRKTLVFSLSTRLPGSLLKMRILFEDRSPRFQ